MQDSYIGFRRKTEIYFVKVYLVYKQHIFGVSSSYKNSVVLSCQTNVTLYVMSSSVEGSGLIDSDIA